MYFAQLTAFCAPSVSPSSRALFLQNGGTLATLDLVLQHNPIHLYLARHGVEDSLVDRLKALNLEIMDEQWVLDSLREGRLLERSPYSFDELDKRARGEPALLSSPTVQEPPHPSARAQLTETPSPRLPLERSSAPSPAGRTAPPLLLQPPLSQTTSSPSPAPSTSALFSTILTSSTSPTPSPTSSIPTLPASAILATLRADEGGSENSVRTGLCEMHHGEGGFEVSKRRRREEEGEV
ncbi:hypothetical protein JCM8547_003727 [Rhodosporidiobolus lusitaniae]